MLGLQEEQDSTVRRSEVAGILSLGDAMTARLALVVNSATYNVANLATILVTILELQFEIG